MDEEKALQEFISKNAKPFDPEKDDYDRPPFAADIKEGKNDPIYNAHSYHTKVPPRSIIPYILHYSNPGDLILDPFCGSGMAGVAALICANPPDDILEQFPELSGRIGPRKAILNELSPAACHIAYNYTTPVDEEQVKREFDRLQAVVEKEFEWLYATEHYEPGVGIYDPIESEVAIRLKNPPSNAREDRRLIIKDYIEPIWELISKEEVEKRLGYSVTELPRSKALPEDSDVGSIKQWICIPANIQYTIWSDVFKCEGLITIEEPTGKISSKGKNVGKPIMTKKRVQRGCGMDVVLWDVAVDKITEKVSENFHCTNYQQKWEKKQLTLLKPKPVVTDYEFKGLRGQKGRGVETAILRISRKYTLKEAKFVSEIAELEIPYWHPRDEVDNGREMLRHGLIKRGLQKTSDFYTKRNLWAMARLWKEIEYCRNHRLRQFLRFAFTSIISYVSLKQSYGGGGGGLSSTLYIASLTSEKNVGEVFRRKASSLLKGLPGFNALAGLTDIRVLLNSASKLPVPDNSVDYIFADPPFGSNIYYADCSILWESWLGNYTDESQEMVVSDRRINGPYKTLEDYSKLMAGAFSEMFRVLKPNRWATIEFNNSDGAVFEAIKNGIQKAGFEIVNMLLLDKKQKSFKQVKGASGEEAVVDKDVLFNLHKPALAINPNVSENRDFERQIVETVREHLRNLPEKIKIDPSKYSDDHRTTATINSMLMNTLIPKGISVEKLNLPFIDRICGRYFRRIGQRWYLRGEAIISGNAQSGELFEEEVSVRDEISAIQWIRQKVSSSPLLIGELKPLWMRATGLLPSEVSHLLNLENLLVENFWRDEISNRWREPTEEERERMNDDRTLRFFPRRKNKLMWLPND